MTAIKFRDGITQSFKVMELGSRSQRTGYLQ